MALAISVGDRSSFSLAAVSSSVVMCQIFAQERLRDHLRNASGVVQRDFAIARGSPELGQYGSLTLLDQERIFPINDP